MNYYGLHYACEPNAWSQKGGNYPEIEQMKKVIKKKRVMSWRQSWRT